MYKRFLKSEAVPTIDDYDIASQTFPNTTTPAPTTPHIPLPSKFRAKRQLLRETTRDSNERAKVVNVNEIEESHTAVENDSTHDHEVGDEKNEEHTLPTESASVFPLDETSINGVNELQNCKHKLKTAQQKCSNYRKTIKRLQGNLKMTKTTTCWWSTFMIFGMYQKALPKS